MEDKIGEASDKVWEDKDGSLHRLLKAQGAEIANPEKALQWFDRSRLASCEIVRFGRFSDAALVDERIISELIGYGGESNYQADVEARLASRSELDALMVASDNVFFFNPAWKTAVRDLCSYASKSGAHTLRLRAFSNDDIIRTVAGFFLGHSGYHPALRVDITYCDRVEIIRGVIDWDGHIADFHRLMTDHFQGDGFRYFMLCHFGDNRGMNADLMDELGLRYDIARETPEGLVNVRIGGASLADARAVGRKSITKFLEENEDFVAGIANLFLAHDQAFGEHFKELEIEDLRAAELRVATQKSATSRKRNYWCGTLDTCNLCHRPFETAKFMIDGATKDGPWACMCARCFELQGGRIALGHGQLYKHTPKGWLLVGGGSP
jgi:hypothetical protein